MRARRLVRRRARLPRRAAALGRLRGREAREATRGSASNRGRDAFARPVGPDIGPDIVFRYERSDAVFGFGFGRGIESRAEPRRAGVRRARRLGGRRERRGGRRGAVGVRARGGAPTERAGFEIRRGRLRQRRDGRPFRLGLAVPEAAAAAARGDETAARAPARDGGDSVRASRALRPRGCYLLARVGGRVGGGAKEREARNEPRGEESRGEGSCRGEGRGRLGFKKREPNSNRIQKKTRARAPPTRRPAVPPVRGVVRLGASARPGGGGGRPRGDRRGGGRDGAPGRHTVRVVRRRLGRERVRAVRRVPERRPPRVPRPARRPEEPVGLRGVRGRGRGRGRAALARHPSTGAFKMRRRERRELGVREPKPPARAARGRVGDRRRGARALGRTDTRDGERVRDGERRARRDGGRNRAERRRRRLRN